MVFFSKTFYFVTMLMRMKASISREVIDMSSNFTVFDIISIPQSRQLSTCCYLTNISLVHISPYLVGENPRKNYGIIWEFCVDFTIILR